MKKFAIDPKGRFENVSKLIYETDADGNPQLVQVLDKNGHDHYQELSKHPETPTWADMVTFHLGSHQRELLE